MFHNGYNRGLDKKILQGVLFRKFRDQIIEMVPAQDPGPDKDKSQKIVKKTTSVKKPE